MTPRQRDALDFINRYVERERIFPSCEEIAVGIGIVSRGHAHALLKTMERDGLIRRTPGHNRNFEVVGESAERRHLKAILAEVATVGTVRPTSTVVIEAMRFLGRAA